MTITVLDPTAGVSAQPTVLNARPVGFAGLTVGLLDNGKPNSDRFLDRLEHHVRAAGAAGIVRRRKANIGRLAAPELIADLAEQCDVVITGVGDCAGCCSCTVQDAAAIERAGRPTYVVCTSEFLTTGRIAAAAAGINDYPFQVIDHPFGSLDADHLQQRADEVAAAIEASW